MRCVSDLDKLRKPLLRRVIKLRLFWYGSRMKTAEDASASIAYAVLELDNLIVCGLRQYTKSCLLGCRSSNGVRIASTAPVRDPPEAAAFVLEHLNKKRFDELGSPTKLDERFEYTFREPRDAYKLLEPHCDTIMPSLLNGMSYNGEVFSRIGTARNFFAHRAEGTAERILRLGPALGMGPVSRPEDVIRGRRAGRPSSIYEEWLTDAENFFAAALE